MRRALLQKVLAALKAYQDALQVLTALAGEGRHAEFLVALNHVRRCKDQYHTATSYYKNHVDQHFCVY